MDKVKRRWESRQWEGTSQRRFFYTRSAATYKASIPFLEIKKNIKCTEYTCAEEVHLDLKGFITSLDYDDDLNGIIPFVAKQKELSFHWRRLIDPDAEFVIDLKLDYDNDMHSRPHAYANVKVDLIRRLITPSVRKLQKIYQRCQNTDHYDRVIKLLQVIDETNQNIGMRTTLRRVPSVLLDKSAEQFLYRIERLLKLRDADIYSSTCAKTEIQHNQFVKFLKHQPAAVGDMFCFITVPKSFLQLLRFYIQQIMPEEDILVLKSIMDGDNDFSWSMIKLYFLSFVINLDHRSFDYFCRSSEKSYFLYQAFVEAKEEHCYDKRPWTHPDKIMDMRNEFARAKRTVTRILSDWRIVSEPLIDRREDCRLKTHRIMSTSAHKTPLRNTTNKTKICDHSLRQIESTILEFCNRNDSYDKVQEIFQNRRHTQLIITIDGEEKRLWRDPSENEFIFEEQTSAKVTVTDEVNQNSVAKIKEERLICSSSAPNPSASASRVSTITRRVKKIRRKAIFFSSNTMSEVKMLLTSSRFYQHLDPVAANEDNNFKRNGELTSFLVNRILPFSCIDEVDEGIGDSNSEYDSIAILDQTLDSKPNAEKISDEYDSDKLKLQNFLEVENDAISYNKANDQKTTSSLSSAFINVSSSNFAIHKHKFKQQRTQIIDKITKKITLWNKRLPHCETTVPIQHVLDAVDWLFSASPPKPQKINIIFELSRPQHVALVLKVFDFVLNALSSSNRSKQYVVRSMSIISASELITVKKIKTGDIRSID